MALRLIESNVEHCALQLRRSLAINEPKDAMDPGIGLCCQAFLSRFSIYFALKTCVCVCIYNQLYFIRNWAENFLKCLLLLFLFFLWES